MSDLPAKQGLYDPAFEHDSCGVGFVVDVHGRKSHEMVQLGLKSLCAHRMTGVIRARIWRSKAINP